MTRLPKVTIASRMLSVVKMAYWWISIDPANLSGFAYWRGTELRHTGTIRAIGSKGRWVRDGVIGRQTYDREWSAWCDLLSGYGGLERVVCEVGRGRFRNVDIPLGMRLGYIRAACHSIDAIPDGAFQLIELSEWRKVIAEAHGVSWSSGKQDKGRSKALSIRLVSDIYGRPVGADEADAVLIGAAAIRTGVAG